jgi:hypothetical protein
MRIMAEMAILALAARACYPEERPDAKRSITVYVDLRAEVLDEKLSDAEFLASRMFEQAGVSLRWHRGRLKSHEVEPIISVGITSNTPPKFRPGALAYAEVYAGRLEGARIRIFFDRIESSGTGKQVPYLLGHVLVHEITHILENSDHHSEEGIMKARWTMNDLYQMAYRPLPFDPVNVQMIRRGLANWGRTATSSRLGKASIADVVAMH